MGLLGATSPATRPAAQAGRFYPSHPERLRRDVEGHLHAGRAVLAAHASRALAPKALIAPHAGYPYSGPIAGTAFAALRPEGIERVVLIGPSHYVAFEGIAVSGAQRFATPLGAVPVAAALEQRLVSSGKAVLLPEAHGEEHALEVELPFLQCCLEAFEVVPLVVGWSTAAGVAAALEGVWGGVETLIVVSSDLSHYLDYQEACAKDRRTADAVVAGHAVGSESACGWQAINGLLEQLSALGSGAASIELLDLRNSGDTEGDRERVVGYGAFAVTLS